jgi:hypothetical protein
MHCYLFNLLSSSNFSSHAHSILRLAVKQRLLVDDDVCIFQCHIRVKVTRSNESHQFQIEGSEQILIVVFTVSEMQNFKSYYVPYFKEIKVSRCC